MAGGAVCSQLAVMRIIRPVAGGASLFCCLKDRFSMCAGMTIQTRGIGMFARQFKIKFIMVEVCPKLVDPIMTLKTGITKCDHVPDHESHIFLSMTVGADGWLEFCDVAPVTIFAQERIILRLELMRFQ